MSRIKFETNEGKIEMRKQKGFSLIELLIVVAIILIIAAIAIPNLLRARMSANEASAVGSIRTLNTAEISYTTTYTAVGFSPNILSLGGAPGVACVPAVGSACLIDSVLAAGIKSGYTFLATSVAGGPPTVSYEASGVPVTVNQTGIRSFCSYEDGVVRTQPTGAAIATVAACQALAPL
jgi:prepilin-type N-terminal cleavage/methylation domain-containing protein